MSDTRHVTQRDHLRVLHPRRTPVMARMWRLAGFAATSSFSQEP